VRTVQLEADRCATRSGALKRGRLDPLLAASISEHNISDDSALATKVKSEEPSVDRRSKREESFV
jgi:hypothetical protein